MTDYTGTGREEEGLLYDCGHRHKSINEALNCKKENLILQQPQPRPNLAGLNIVPIAEIISKILNSKLRQTKLEFQEQTRMRENLRFNLEECEKSVRYLDNTLLALKQTLTQLNLKIEE